MKRDIDWKEFLAKPRRRPSEPARMLRPRETPDAYADAVLSELRAMRTEMASLRDLLTEHMQANGPPPQEEILTRQQTAQVLCVCIESVTKLVRDEGLPCRRVGKEYRFLRSQVLAWLGTRQR